MRTTRASGLRPLGALLLVPIIVLSLTPARFLFRRGKDEQEQRHEAFDQLFAFNREVFETAAAMKSRWMDHWMQRDQDALPPRYRQENFIYPRAVEAAFDMRFATALLHRNRWKSKVQPLFAEVDQRQWKLLRSTLAHASIKLVNINERYGAVLRADETVWIDHAIEDFDEARRVLRRQEADEVEEQHVVAETTFRTVLVAAQLSQNLLERLEEEAAEER